MKSYYWLEFMLLSFLVLISGTIQVSIHPSVTLCKRSDPNISDCYCSTFAKMIPILKDGSRQMRIPPLDPISVENIVMDLTRLRSLHLVANLFNITGRGLSTTRLPNCYLKQLHNGPKFFLTLEAPLLTLDSDYSTVGSFANYTLNATGDFHAEFRSVFVHTVWTATKYMKKNQEHLEFNCTMNDFEVGNIKIHFNKIFDNNPRMDATLNALIADNIDILTGEIEPIVVNILKTISVEMVDVIFDTFPYDVLFPL